MVASARPPKGAFAFLITRPFPVHPGGVSLRLLNHNRPPTPKGFPIFANTKLIILSILSLIIMARAKKDEKPADSASLQVSIEDFIRTRDSVSDKHSSSVHSPLVASSLSSSMTRHIHDTPPHTFKTLCYTTQPCSDRNS